MDDTNGCVSPLEAINIPAIPANTWTPVCIPYANAGALTAVISVGLKAINDVGACTIYLDDIRSVDKYTGTASNLFSVVTFNNTLVATNGVNQTKKYTGNTTTGEQNMTMALAAGTISTTEVLLVAKDHLIAFNNTENGADAPQRGSWTNIGQLDDWTGGTAGYQDLTDDYSGVIAADQLSENTWAIYKEVSIVVMEWVGGQTPFRFTTMVKNKTIAGKASVININGIHLVIGTKDVYKYTGTDVAPPIDSVLKRTFYNAIDYTYILRSFILYLEEDDEVQFWIPTSTQYPDTIFCLDVVSDIWYRKSRTMMGAGTTVSSSTLTVGDLVGTVGSLNFAIGSTTTKSNTPIYIVGDANGQVFKLDKTVLDNNGVAITNEFQTPDFIFPTTQVAGSSKDIFSVLQSASLKPGQFQTFRVQQLVFEAYGQSITCSYSIDGGQTFNPCQADGTSVVALIGSYLMYQLDMDVVCQKIRFKFLNNTVSSGFYLRHYGFAWKPRSTRK